LENMRVKKANKCLRVLDCEFLNLKTCISLNIKPECRAIKIKKEVTKTHTPSLTLNFF